MKITSLLFCNNSDALHGVAGIPRGALGVCVTFLFIVLRSFVVFTVSFLT